MVFNIREFMYILEGLCNVDIFPDAIANYSNLRQQKAL